MHDKCRMQLADAHYRPHSVRRCCEENRRLVTGCLCAHLRQQQRQALGVARLPRVRLCRHHQDDAGVGACDTKVIRCLCVIAEHTNPSDPIDYVVGHSECQHHLLKQSSTPHAAEGVISCCPRADLGNASETHTPSRC